MVLVMSIDVSGTRVIGWVSVCFLFLFFLGVIWSQITCNGKFTLINNRYAPVGQSTVEIASSKSYQSMLDTYYQPYVCIHLWKHYTGRRTYPARYVLWWWNGMSRLSIWLISKVTGNYGTTSFDGTVAWIWEMCVCLCASVISIHS